MSASKVRESAAGIIVVGERDPHVLLACRNPQLRFMGGHHVFPGGQLDKGESIQSVTGAGGAVEAAAIHTAAREIFEETGLLFVDGERPPVEQLRTMRTALLKGTKSFEEILQRGGLVINTKSFEPAGVFVTPKFSPIRFSARYYVVRHERPAGEELIEGEMTSLDWMRPSEARERWREGTILLPPPVAFTLRHLERLPLDEAVARLSRSRRFTAGAGGAMEVRCGVYMLPLLSPTLPPATHTNCVIVGERELFVIDPGATDPQEQTRLVEQLEYLLDGRGRVKAVVLTHGHIDHRGAAPFLRDHYGVPIWAHQATANRVEFPIDRLLRDNDVISIAGDPDWRMRCLHTPGHHPGHLCFIEDTTNVLIAGDLLSGYGSVVIPHGSGGDMSAYLDSLRGLLEEDFDLMVPGHGFFMPHPKDEVRKSIEHRMWREERIKKALDMGVGSVEELLAQAYSDVSREMRQFAEATLKAHLSRLGVTQFDF